MKPEWVITPIATLNESARNAAIERQQVLTKPPGALGRLESLAIDLAAMQGQEKPMLEQVRIAVFAADHGIADEGVSAFPQAVTTEMVRNFARGGAAISVLSRQIGATLEVVNLGTVDDPGPLPGVVDERIAACSGNFLREPAMTEEQLARALDVGRQTVQRAKDDGAQLFIGGDMGIANTTSATALACALLQAAPAELAGPGTGLDKDGVTHKARVIEQALAFHGDALDDAYQVLRLLGGFEIAALTGSFIACAQLGLPVLVDGFITSVAALVATRLHPDCAQWFMYGHASAEPGHSRILQALDAEPLLNLGMRLGEASGAATAVCLLRQACALHNEMATFAEAGVSEKSE
jgi:nicotinate-nucleotide--dimethylbenzimidazole phosphoribosyltransferase